MLLGTAPGVPEFCWGPEKETVMYEDEYEMGLPENDLLDDEYSTASDDGDEDDGYQFTDWAII